MHRQILSLLLAANVCSAQAADSEALLKEAETARQAKQYDAAIAGYEKALAMELSEDARVKALVNLAQAHNSKMEWEKALALLEKAQALRPKDASIRYLKGDTFFRGELMGDAIRSYTEAIELRPLDPVMYSGRASAYMKTKRYQDALKDCDEAIRLNPDSGPFVAKRGDLHHMWGNYEEALRDYAGALRIDPNQADVYNNRAELQKTHRRWDLALPDYNKAVELDASDADTLSNRALCHLDLGNWREAIADLEHLLTLTPDDAEPRSNLAFALAASPDAAVRDGKRAITIATKACELTQWKNVKHIDVLAMAHAETGDFDQALATLDRTEGLTASGVSSEGVKSRRALYQKKQPFRATPASDLTAVARKTNEVTAWLSAGQAAMQQDQMDRAAEMFRKVLQMPAKPDEKALAHSSLAMIRMSRGDSKSALAACAEAIKLEPDEPLHYRIRAKMLTALGEDQKAQADLNTIKRLESGKK